MQAQHQPSRMTYADLKNKPISERWELIDGILLMQAAPSWQHQFISRELTIALSNAMKNRNCEVYAAPFDVFLMNEENQDDKAHTVVQPDLAVICDPSHLRNTGYHGTPELIIEITSPSTARVDRLTKMNLYANAGVSHYWIVSPEERTLSRYENTDGSLILSSVLQEQDTLEDALFPTLHLPMQMLFPHAHGDEG